MVQNTRHQGGECALSSSLFVYAKPKRPLQLAVSRMLLLPNIVQSRNGTVAELLIKTNPGGSAYPVLHLGKDMIQFKFFFAGPSQAIYKLNLSIFLSMLLYLDDFYEIDIKPLYPALIEALSGISKDISEALEHNRFRASEAKIVELSRSNVYLYDRVRELYAKLEASAAGYSELNGAILKVIKYFVDTEGNDPEKVAASMQAFGFSKEEIEKLFDRCNVLQGKVRQHAHKI